MLTKKYIPTFTSISTSVTVHNPHKDETIFNNKKYFTFSNNKLSIHIDHNIGNKVILKPKRIL